MRRRALRCALRRPRCLSSRSTSSGAGVTAGCVYSGASRHCSSRTSASPQPPSSSPQPPSSSPSAQSSSSSVSSGPSALQQQLSFCCLMCGWETACTSCPFNWYGFDPRKFRDRQQQSRRRGGTAGCGNQQELEDALATLGLTGRVDAREVKAAFRAKALEWHPDCSAHEDAEDMFKEIVRAYELLLAAFLSSK